MLEKGAGVGVDGRQGGAGDGVDERAPLRLAQLGALLEVLAVDLRCKEQIRPRPTTGIGMRGKGGK